MNTENIINYGQLNPRTIGTTLKEIMRRTIEEIWKRRIGFVGQEKLVAYKADPADRVTDADFAAQEVFIRKLGECFPGYGIVAEEHGFRRECIESAEIGGTNSTKLFFTVDPLDGTKAFERRQSGGFGPMLSLCSADKVIAAFVGDAMTGELYYYRPESDKVHRLNFGDHQYETLAIDEERKLSKQYVVIRDNPLDIPEPYCHVAQSLKHGGLFKDMEVIGGGIGTGMARLWKGEIGGYVIKAGAQTPWDLLPVWGISEKLGFICLSYDEGSGLWRERQVKPAMDIIKFETPSIFIHRSRFIEFTARGDRISV